MHGNFTETVHKDIYFMNLPSSQIPLDSCVYEGHIFQGPFLEFFIRNSTCKLILIYFAVCMVAQTVFDMGSAISLLLVKHGEEKKYL